MSTCYHNSYAFSVGVVGQATTRAKPSTTLHTRQVKVRLYESLAALEGLRAEWDELLSEVPSATTFSTWEWLAPWWRAFGSRQRLTFLAFFSSGERLVGLAPLSLTSWRVTGGLSLRMLRMMGDGSSDSDNLDLIACSGLEDAVADALFEFLESCRHTWDICALNTLPSNSQVGRALISRLEQRNWTRFTYGQEGYVVDLPEDWESYRMQLSYNERGQLGKFSRRLERDYQVRVYRCAAEVELEPCLHSLFELHQKRWRSQGQPGSFACEERRRFYGEISRLFLARGWLQLWLLDLNGVTAAAEFDFRYRDTVYCLQGGFDTDVAKGHLGFVLRGHVLKELIAQQVRHYDFLAGQEFYKSRWGGHATRYLNIHFARPKSRGAAYLYIKHESQEAKAWLRARLPKEAWPLLHYVNTRLKGTRNRTRREEIAQKAGQE